MDNLKRPRRLRKSDAIRELVSETRLSSNDFIFPIFIDDNQNSVTSIPSLPGINRYSVDRLEEICEEVSKQHVLGVALFPSINENKKDSVGSIGLDEKNCLCKAVQYIKKEFPHLIVITDVALDPYSSDGHDGIVENGKIINDKTVDILSEMAVLHAQVGADFVAPSDMMDGRVVRIRESLDKKDFIDTGIISYTAKYASAFYGPFREALNSTPKEGDKKTYQMSPANKREALREALLDEEEGADILMVKPALAYLDIIQSIKENTTLPVAAYHVSGEYAMLKHASKEGLLNYDDALLEVITSIKRAGADIIFTYAALELSHLIQKIKH